MKEINDFACEVLHGKSCVSWYRHSDYIRSCIANNSLFQESFHYKSRSGFTRLHWCRETLPLPRLILFTMSLSIKCQLKHVIVTRHKWSIFSQGTKAASVVKMQQSRSLPLSFCHTATNLEFGWIYFISILQDGLPTMIYGLLISQICPSEKVDKYKSWQTYSTLANDNRTRTCNSYCNNITSTS